MAEQRTTAKERYEELEPQRRPFLERAREYARLTLPSLLPEDGHTSSQSLPATYQSFSARLVTTLAARLMTALFPAGRKSFKLAVTPEILAEAGEESTPPEMARKLALNETTVDSEITRRRWRSATYLSCQHLIVTGNVMEKLEKDNRVRVFPLDRYVVRRDAEGNMIEGVTLERLLPDSLDDDLRPYVDEDDSPDPEHVELYTWFSWSAKDGVWKIHQEVGEQFVTDSEGEYDVNPFNALRWTEEAGSDYGRAKIEEHYGDIASYEGFSKNTSEGGAMASRNITMIRPNSAGGLNLRRRLAKAKNGDYVVGNPDDVEMKQFENNSGMSIAANEKAELKHELAQAFLLNSAARRDAERVTAYELRMMIDEIESVLGGVYSTLADEMLSHRIKRLMVQMRAAGQLPDYPEDAVEPVILTGLEALGRERDVERVNTAVQMLNAMPEKVQQSYVRWSDLLTKLMNGLDLADTINSEEEAQKIMQQMAMMEQMAKAQSAVQGAAPTTEGEQ